MPRRPGTMCGCGETRHASDPLQAPACDPSPVWASRASSEGTGPPATSTFLRTPSAPGSISHWVSERFWIQPARHRSGTRLVPVWTRRLGARPRVIVSIVLRASLPWVQCPRRRLRPRTRPRGLRCCFGTCTISIRPPTLGSSQRQLWSRPSPGGAQRRAPSLRV